MTLPKPHEKLFYSPQQAAKLVGIPSKVLKLWQRDFRQLKLLETANGGRYFTRKDITLLFLIKELHLEKKLFVNEIQDHLIKKSRGSDQEELLKLRQAIAEIRLEIDELLTLLKTPTRH